VIISRLASSATCVFRSEVALAAAVLF